MQQLERKYDTANVFIQYVHVNNEPYFNNGAHSFNHLQSNFRFSFTSVNLQNGGDNEYAYMLEGADERWTYAGRLREVNFNSLAPGGYVFKVKVRNPEGVWSPVTTYPFTILPPFWHTWWFYFLVACSVLSAGYSLYRYRVTGL